MDVSRRNGAKPKILVTDAGRGCAIAILRSLGRKGYRLVAADGDPGSLGYFSRYAHESATYPLPESDPDAFCEFLLETVRRRGVDLVIPVTDLVIQPLAQARAAFEPYTRLAIPDPERLRVVTDKDATVALARKLGVPVPKTYTVNTVAEALAHAADLGWPVVLKPHISRLLRPGERIEKYSVSYAGDAESLREHMARLEGRCAVLLQRYLHGVGHGVELLLHEGEPLAAFQHKRLREIPVTGGPSAYRESVRLDPELFKHAVRLLQAVGWTGLAMVEFKVGQGRAELMEINGRIWGSLPLAVASGVDFPAMLAQLYLEGAEGLPRQLDSNYKIGLRCRDLGRDLMWMYQVLRGLQKHPCLPMPRRREAVGAFLSLFNPRNKFDLLTLEDPLPGLAELPRIYQKFKRKRQES